MAAEPETEQVKPRVFNPGQIIDGKWKIKALLGKGACGVVYKVEDKKRKGWMAAMKIEYISEDFDQTLRLEIGVLNKMKKHTDMLKLLDYGRRKTFTYMVTNLCGKDLMALRCKIKRGFNDSSALRIAVFTLYGLKQTHELGYVHRDVKPGNIITASSNGRDSRCLLLIDFGMARSFITSDKDGKKQIRIMRRRIPLRGTVRYCSLNVHDRLEQGRCDDLIAMIYMLIEVTLGVPWHHLTDEKEVLAMKKSTKDSDLFEELPEELKQIFEYLKPLSYSDRPNYLKIYNLLMTAIKRLKINFLDAYEWEDEEIEKDLKMEKEKKLKEEEAKKDVKEAPKEVEAEKKKVGEIQQESSPETKTNRDINLNLVPNKDQTTKSEYDPKSTISAVSADSFESKHTGLDTAIDYDPIEFTTKKAMNREDLQFLVYPSISIANFKEHAIPF